MAKSKTKKSIASHSLRESAKARLAAQKPAKATKVPTAPPVATDANVGEPVAKDANVPETKATKTAKAKDQTPTEPRKLSALDAAARVLQEMGGAMNCPALIALMSAKGLWSSPAGKTPSATLAAAVMREIATKGDQSRFRKTGRGLFAAATTNA
jgi:hypothetical protein